MNEYIIMFCGNGRVWTTNCRSEALLYLSIPALAASYAVFRDGLMVDFWNA